MTASLLPLPAARRNSFVIPVVRAALSLPLAALRHPGRALVIRRGTGQVAVR